MEDYEQKDKTENNVSEPQAAYNTAIYATMDMEGDVNFEEDSLEIDSFYEKNKDAIETVYERIRKDETVAPEGYYTLKEFDELFKKKLAEVYETL